MRELMIVCGLCASFISESYGNNTTYSAEYWTEKVEKYFNQLDSFEADFWQTMNNKNVAGKIWLKRPILRFTLGNITIVAQKHKITQYNSRLKEKTENQKNPYSALLKRPMKLTDVVNVGKVSKVGGVLHFTVHPRDIAVDITFMFDVTTSGLVLKGWNIKYNSQKEIKVKLGAMKPIKCDDRDLLNYSKDI